MRATGSTGRGGEHACGGVLFVLDTVGCSAAALPNRAGIESEAPLLGSALFILEYAMAGTCTGRRCGGRVCGFERELIVGVEL